MHAMLISEVTDKDREKTNLLSNIKPQIKAFLLKTFVLIKQMAYTFTCTGIYM